MAGKDNSLVILKINDSYFRVKEFYESKKVILYKQEVVGIMEIVGEVITKEMFELGSNLFYNKLLVEEE